MSRSGAKELPNMALAVLEKGDSFFFKRHLPIVSRLLENKCDQNLIIAFNWLDELFRSHIGSYGGQWDHFLMLLVDSSAVFSRSHVGKFKEHEGLLKGRDGILEQIKDTAVKLAQLMRKADEIAENWGAVPPHYSDPFQLIIDAAERMRTNKDWRIADTGCRFDGNLKKYIENIQCQFDSKYRPSTIHLIEEIANKTDAGNLEYTFETDQMRKQNHKYNMFMDNFFMELNRSIETGRLTPKILEINEDGWTDIFIFLLEDDQKERENNAQKIKEATKKSLQRTQAKRSE